MDGRQGRPSKTTYFDRLEEEKERGHAFFPGTIFKDFVAASMVLVIVVVLAALKGAPLELEANPAGSAKAPRPEWYFLFLFEALKYLPGHLEWIGAVLVPGIAVIALFLLPLYDRSPWRHPLNRPLATGLAVFLVAAISLLTYGAVTSPEPAAVGAPSLAGKLTPLERAGKGIYEDNRCAVCHRINGVGGSIGPDLSVAGRRLDASWVLAHLERPGEVAPGTRMPQITLTNTEMMSLTAYLLSLKQPETRTPAQLGEAIYAVYCGSCHPGGKAGIGPSLVGVSTEKAAGFVRSGGRGMPAFGTGELTDEQLTLVVSYLRTLR